MFKTPKILKEIFPALKKRDALFEAIRQDNFAEVKKLLDAGTNLNGKSDRGYPLAVAAAFSRVEMVQLLLEKGADLRKDNFYAYGTAYMMWGLREFYTQPSYSEDKAFFEQKKLAAEKTLTVMRDWAKTHNIALPEMKPEDIKIQPADLSRKDKSRDF